MNQDAINSVVAGARNPHNWLASADELKRASDLLREVWLTDLGEMRSRFDAYMAGELDAPWEPWVGGPAMTLAAYAMENVFKGLIVAADPSLVHPETVNSDVLFDTSLRSHDLVLLAERAKVPLTGDEERVLRRLSEFGWWAGKYRFPVRVSRSLPRPGVESGGSSFSSDWFPIIDPLFDRLRADLFAAGVAADRRKESEDALPDC